MDEDAYEPLDGAGAYLPTPAEIEKGCRLIRSTWSLREHYIRAGKRVPGWLTRHVDLQAE